MVASSTFEDFLLNAPAQVDLSNFIVSLLIATVLSIILGGIYVRFGTSISNRKKFARNFMLLIPTTTLIITVVKSSLALSLGLVGALSIVRFRAAIKEPEELAFLFLAIAIGLGLGAGQLFVTLIAFFIISLLVWARHSLYKKDENQNLYITISGKTSRDLTLRKIVDILKKRCSSVHLKRFDKKEEDILESAFLVDIGSFDNLEKLKNDLSDLSKTVKISYLDKEGLF